MTRNIYLFWLVTYCSRFIEQHDQGQQGPQLCKHYLHPKSPIAFQTFVSHSDADGRLGKLVISADTQLEGPFIGKFDKISDSKKGGT